MINQKLYRTRENKIIAGVCAGLDKYWGVDVNFSRALFCLFGLLSGIGLIFYILLVIFVPLESVKQADTNRP